MVATEASFAAVRKMWSEYTDDRRLINAMKKIEMVPESGCWIWMGTTNEKGYGRLKTTKGKMYAHRFFYQQLVGPIPDGMFVCHRCDVTSCCNPAHHFIGDMTANMEDMKKKGRQSKAARMFGEKHPQAILNDAKVREIRRSKAPLAELAKVYGVALPTINDVRRGVTWRHLIG